MTPEAWLTGLDAVAAWLVPAIVRVTLDGALVALPVWALCRFVPSLPASLRAWMWWAVSLKLLVSLAGLPGPSLPVLPAGWPAPGVERGPALVAAPTTAVPRPGLPIASPAADPAGAPDRAATVGAPRSVGPSVLAAAWLLGVALHLTLLVRDGWRLRRLLARAAPVAGTLAEEHEDLAKDLGLNRVPPLRESSDLDVPQVVGLARPTVLLPRRTASPLSPHERTMTLCHELAHVRRRDLVFGWVPALAERLLVGHPLGWWAAREYALAREAACDELVLNTLDAAPQDYGRLLLRLGVSAPASRVAAAGASPTSRLLLRRLRMLQQVPRWSPQGVRASVVLAALVAGLLPIRLATAHTGGDPSPADTQPATTPAPAAPAAAPTSPSHAVAAQPSTPSTPSTSPQLPTPPARPSTPVEPLRGRHAARESWYFIDADGSTHGSGDWHDIERARRARAPGSGPAFVFTSRGTAFIVEDAKTVEQVRAILEPQTELGRQQGELGARQGALGQEQGKLGAEQGALGVRQAEISVRQAALAARIASANADILAVAANRMRGQSADTEALRRAEADAKAKLDEVDRQMRDLGEKQAALGEQQGQLGAKQAELGDRQAILGTEQARLGHLQRVAAEKAEGELRAVAERAIAAGLARPVK